MTLVDSRPGIRHALTAYRAETGVPIDVDAIVGRFGPPIRGELLPCVGDDGIDDAMAIFRRHLAEVGVQQSIALPGAAAALAAVHDSGGRSLVVTAKPPGLAVATLRHAGLEPDDVVGDVWGTDKAAPLVEHGAVAYVGDHTADVEAARAAGVISVAVTTGPVDAAGLAAADHVLTSLAELPDLITAWARMSDTDRS